MRLEAVNHDEKYVWEENVESLTAEDGYAESVWKTNLVDERVEKEAWEGRREVEMPWRGAPIGRLLFDNVVNEAC